MPLSVGTNSWVTVTEADTYLGDQVGGAEWFTLPESSQEGEDSKELYLISAFRWLIYAPELDISESSTDDNVKNAQIEAARWLLDHYLELDERRAALATGVTEFQYSRRRERLDYKQLTIPAHIIGMLSEYAQMNVTVELEGEYDV